MRWTITIVPVAMLWACGKTDEKPPVATRTSPVATTAPAMDASPASAVKPALPAAPACTRQPFAATLDLAEASAATWMADASLLVVGDSGTHGAYVRVDPKTGKILSRGTLPLDSGASDDLEGLSRVGSTLYGITSSGYLREWELTDDGFTLAQTSYSVAGTGPAALTCASATDFNCGPNYEGLCLLANPNPDAPCVGFAAAKAKGTLMCLVKHADGRLALDPQHTIVVAGPKTLSGCSFDESERLWFGNNIFSANVAGIVVGHEDPKLAVITRLGPLGIGNSEAIVAGPDGQVFRFSDTSGSSSLLDKYICR